MSIILNWYDDSQELGIAKQDSYILRDDETLDIFLNLYLEPECVGTVIRIAPPTGGQYTVYIYENCSVNMSITDRAGEFSITLPFYFETDISSLGVGYDVEINQNGHVFKGWVITPPITRNGPVKTITLEGADYTAKTQKIIVTESYSSVAVSTIIDDLFQKYVPWATRNNISTISRPLTIRFPDVYLWDAMEQICELTGYNWYIDKNLDVNFFETANNINENTLSETSYKKGTASFTQDTSKLVNKLWVKGSKALSLPFTQNITVSGTTPINLYYTPRAGDTGITVTIGGVNKTLGIQNITTAGTKDFLINVAEKLLIPDLTTSGSGSITYRYEYPIKIYLEDEDSKASYGEFEDAITVDIDDASVAREVGTRYIEKYSKPVTIGSIEPFIGTYHCGELLKVELSALNIDEYLLIKSVSYESVVGLGLVNIKLSLENTQKDFTTIMKSMEKRLRKIESALFATDNETTIEKYKVVRDSIEYLKLTDDGTSYKVHDYVMAGANIVGGVFTI